MKLVVGSDHRGFQLKTELIEHLKEEGHEVTDIGTYGPASVNYPVYGEKVGRAVASGEYDFGIVVCGTGFGISLAANAVKGVRAVCCSDVWTATYTRRHNNANVLAMGADVLGRGLAFMIADAFLSNTFEGGRHIKRLAMVEEVRRNNGTTGKFIDVHITDRVIRLYNQRCREWTHPYEYAPNPGGTLTNSGCGIFSLCECIEMLSGKRVAPEELADFSVREGGRGEDGTDRPALLRALAAKGLDAEYGFAYQPAEQINDRELLWKCLSSGGCALTNLRAGHIVALLDCRIAEDGERQVLAMDCHSESADERIASEVREVIGESEIQYDVMNDAGVRVGKAISCGLFWVPITLAKNFDLLQCR